MKVNVHEAKMHFSELLKRIALGEEIVIRKGGKPIARLGANQRKTEEAEAQPASHLNISVIDIEHRLDR